MLFAGLAEALKEEIYGRSVGDFREFAEAAIAEIEKLSERADLRVDDAKIELGARACERFRFGYCFGERFGSFQQFFALVLVGVGDGEQNAAEAGAATLILGRKIRAAEKRFAVGHQKAGERPTALAADGADGGLVAGIDVRAFVAVHFYGNEMLVDDFGDGGIFVAFAVNDVAPVAPDGADVEENGLVLRFREAESVFAPFVPVDGLVGGGTEVGASGSF